MRQAAPVVRDGVVEVAQVGGPVAAREAARQVTATYEVRKYR